MLVKHATGQGASAIKYDILSALLAMATQDAGVDGRLALRLSVLITARYNWRSGALTVGQREIARLWGVTERTAKRDLAQMKARGWLTVTRPAARGRVATHRIEIDTVLRATMPVWPSIGPDFEARMTDTPPPAQSNVVPLVPRAAAPVAGQVWPAASARLHTQDPAAHAAWFQHLEEKDVQGDALHLVAPTGFVATYVETHFSTRLLAAVAATHPEIREVRVRPPS